jgi:hypothetical protein
MEHNNQLSYLGMLVSLEQNTAIIDTTYFVEKLLENTGILLQGKCQATNRFFMSVWMQHCYKRRKGYFFTR